MSHSFPHTGEIRRPGEYTGGTDEFGTATGSDVYTKLYDGRLALQEDTERALRSTESTEADAVLFVPDPSSGWQVQSHEIRPDDEYVHSDGRTGRVIEAVWNYRTHHKALVQWL